MGKVFCRCLYVIASIVLPYILSSFIIHAFPFLPHRAGLTTSDQDPSSYPLVTQAVPSPVTVAVREGCLHPPPHSSLWRWHCSPPPPVTSRITRGAHGGEGRREGRDGKRKNGSIGGRREGCGMVELHALVHTNHGTGVPQSWYHWHHDIWGT